MSLMSPFLCSIINRASFHSNGIFFFYKIWFKIFVVCLTDSSLPSIMTSLVRLSMARAMLLFFFNLQINYCTPTTKCAYEFILVCVWVCVFVCVCVCVCERERERETGRQTDRQRLRDRDRERKRERESEREREREREREGGSQTERDRDKEIVTDWMHLYSSVCVCVHARVHMCVCVCVCVCVCDVKPAKEDSSQQRVLMALNTCVLCNCAHQMLYFNG